MAEKIMSALRLIDGPTIINGFYINVMKIFRVFFII